MQFGLMTEPQVGGSYEDLLALTKWADGQGLDAFARSDHYLNGDTSAPATDALTTMGGLARETERIELVVLVTPLTFRHPAVIAKTAATIDEMSNGRFALGIGTGWMEQEHEAFGLELYPMKERFSRLFETLAYVHGALEEGANGFEGRHYSLAEVDVQPKRTGRLPIIVGGSGMKKTPMMAGRFADEYNMFVSEADSVRQRLTVAAEAAKEAGRDPADIMLSFAGPALITETEAEYTELLAERGAKRDMSPDLYEQFLADRHVPRGTAEQVADVVGQLETLGVGRYYVQEFKALGDIDTDRLEMVFRSLRS